MKIHVVRKSRPTDILYPFNVCSDVQVATYVLHISQGDKDIPPDWIINSATLLDAEGTEWPLSPDSRTSLVWYATVLSRPTPNGTPQVSQSLSSGQSSSSGCLKLIVRDDSKILLTDAQKEELKIDITEKPISLHGFETLLCQYLTKGINLRLFDRLFIDPPTERVFSLATASTVNKGGGLQGWTLDLEDHILPMEPPSDIAIN